MGASSSGRRESTAYLDEDVPPDLARLLRTRGTDAVSVHEINALGLPDEAQLTRAAAEGRALLTCKYDDFLILARSWQLGGHPHAGVVISYHQYRRRELEPPHLSTVV